MLFSLSLLALFAASSPTPQQEEVIPIIVGGVPVSPKFKYPWIVSLQNSGSHFCGGSLLDATTVITAAHCSQRKPSSTLKVQAHRHNLGDSAESEKALIFDVVKIIVNPGYSSSVYSNDVAIWKVKLISGDATTINSGAIILDDGSSAADKDGSLLEIIGWGTTGSGGSLSKTLLTTAVNVVNRGVCAKAYSKLDATSICATAPGKDTCQGDSGGPMFTTNASGVVVLVGLTSYGQGCAQEGYPGVYSYVSKLIPFITSASVDE